MNPLRIIGTGSKPVLKVQDVLTDESKWTQHVYARNSKDEEVGSQEDVACKFCLSGAIHRATPTFKAACELHSKVSDYLKTHRKYEHGITAWNDLPSRTFAEIRGLIEEMNL